MNEEYQKLYDVALRLLAGRPRTIEEIRKRLTLYAKKRKGSTTYIEKIISGLITQKLLDDTEFTKWWVEQRNTFRPKGKRALVVELRQKGIDKETITTILASYDTSYESELAKKLIEKKFLTHAQVREKDMRKKMIDFLLRRGFSWDIIESVVDPEGFATKG